MYYHLQKYKGPSTRHTCPACGRRRCFTLYVDENGMPLDASVGRCDHESACGYHLKPREYLEKHPGRKTAWRNNEYIPMRKAAPVSIGIIPDGYVTRSRSNNSRLVSYLMSLATDRDRLEKVLDDYLIGCTQSGATIFWQIDTKGRVRTGKIIEYQHDGHRNKDAGANWAHSILKKRGVLDDGWTLCQCLFGEHLLGKEENKAKIVGVVESEKTALICATQFPQLIWLATGGKSQMSAGKMRPLAGRTVIFYPDIDGYADWVERVKEITFCRSVTISDFLSRNATESDREDKVDVADLLLREWGLLKRTADDNPQVKAGRLLEEMI